MPLLNGTSIPRTTYTQADLRANVRADLNYSSLAVIQDSDVDRWGKAAQDQIALESRWYVAEAQIPLVSGTAEYAIPSGSIAIREVWKDNLRLRLVETPDLWWSWRTMAGAGGALAYFINGETTIGVLPTPSASGTLRVFCEALPPAPTGDTDRYWCPYGLEEAIACHARLRASQKDIAASEGATRIPSLEGEWARWLMKARGYVQSFAEEDVLSVGSDGLSRVRFPRIDSFGNIHP